MNLEQGWVNGLLQQCCKYFTIKRGFTTREVAYLEMNREREDAVILRNFSLVLKARCSWAGPAKLRIRSAQDASQAQHDAMKGH